MPINVMSLLINKRILENNNVPGERTTRLALIPAALNVGLAESAVLATVIGRREGVAPPPAKDDSDRTTAPVAPRRAAKKSAPRKAVAKAAPAKAGPAPAPAKAAPAPGPGPTPPTP